MTIATVQFMSQALWRQVTYTALLPDEAVVGSGPYPVLYQLHGGNQNHTAWLQDTNLLRYTRDLAFIVILPDGAQSRWANGGLPFTAYEDFLMEELSLHVRHTFPATNGKWAIDDNRHFHAFLEARGIPHTYFEHPGGHTWEYWDSHVQEALQQHRDAFKQL